MISITVVSGDITDTQADVLITGIGLDGTWIGGVNHAIQQTAGVVFHDQLKAALPLADGQLVLAVPNSGTYRGAFRSVLFVADARARPLGELLLPALQEAERFKAGRLSIPALRTGAAAGEYERSTLEVAEQLCAAVHGFAASNPQWVKEIQFVILGDPSMAGLFSWILTRKSSSLL